MRSLQIFFLVLTLSITLYAQWEWRNPLPQANSLKKIFFIDSTTGWIVGNKGTFLKSTFESDWKVKYYENIQVHLTSIYFINENIGWVVSSAPGTQEEGQIFKTSDGGQSWFQTAILPKKLYDVEFVSSDVGWVVGIGLISKTTDGGMTWSNQLLDPLARFHTCYFADSLKGWAVGHPGTGIYQTSDGGALWNRQDLNPGGTYLSIAFSDVNNGWIAGQLDNNQYASLYRSTDGGLTWFESPMTGAGFKYCHIH